MTEAGFANELTFGGALNEVDEPAVRCRQLRADLGQRQAPFLFRHAGVEGVDAPVPYGVPRWRTALEDERQVVQRLLFPRGHVREDVSYRPGTGDTGPHQLHIRQTGVRLVERHPCLIESFQKLSSIRESLTLSAGSGRSSECQVDAVATHQEVMSRLEWQDAVIAKSGGTAPDDHVAMNQRHAARRVGSTQSSQQEDRRQSEGDGHDRSREIALVLVLMQ